MAWASWFRARRPGQGVIEYAGGMIVAIVLVTSVLLVVGQNGLTNLYQSLFDTVGNFFTTQGANITG
jgi:Fe2+ transport system protein B